MARREQAHTKLTLDALIAQKTEKRRVLDEFEQARAQKLALFARPST